MKWIALVVGGVAGTIARYLLSGFVYHRFGGDFPSGTFVVNMLGCFLVSFFATISADKFYWGLEGRLLLMVGFCGAFTTFSAFMLETVTLMRDGHSLKAFFNVTMSIVAGFLALQAGVWAGELAAKV